jgi:hypothetical protein
MAPATAILGRLREEREEWNLAAGCSSRATEEEVELTETDEEEEKGSEDDVTEEEEEADDADEIVEEKEADLDLLSATTAADSVPLSRRRTSGPSGVPKKCSSFRWRRFRLLLPTSPTERGVGDVAAQL